MLVRFLAYAGMGVVLEVFFVALSKLIDGKIRGRDIYLEGHTYLWMIPIYGILLLFIFEPVHAFIMNWNIIVKWFIWAMTFTFFEAASGFGYDKLLGFCPWDYSQSKWKMFKKGYTKWSLVPLWGMAGLFIEGYSYALVHSSDLIWNSYVGYLIKFWSF